MKMGKKLKAQERHLRLGVGGCVCVSNSMWVWKKDLSSGNNLKILINISNQLL